MIGLVLATALTVQATDPQYRIPTELCRGYWMVPVTLQARESETEPRTLWFLHDTGASTTFVDPDSLERVSNRQFENGQRVTIVDASAGPVQINRMPVRVRDLDHLSIALGREIDGLMSVHTFDDFLLILDYPAEEMRLREGALPRPNGETVFSTRGPDRRPWLMVNFAGRQQRLLIDSGAAGTGFAVNDIDQFRLTEPAREVKAAVRFDRLEPRRVSRLDGDADVAGLRFQSPILEEVPRSALLGGEALRHFVITLDQDNRRVEFMAARNEAVPAEPYIELGAVMRPTARGFEVLRLYEGLPFIEAGVEVGDVISHYNGRPIAERGCSPIEPGTLRLTVQRDDATLELEAELTPVFEAVDP